MLGFERLVARTTLILVLLAGTTAFTAEPSPLQSRMRALFQTTCETEISNSRLAELLLERNFGRIDPAILEKARGLAGFNTFVNTLLFLENTPAEYFTELADILSRPMVNLLLDSAILPNGIDSPEEFRAVYFNMLLARTMFGDVPEYRDNPVIEILSYLLTLLPSGVLKKRDFRQSYDEIERYVIYVVKDPENRKVLSDPVADFSIQRNKVEQAGKPVALFDRTKAISNKALHRGIIKSVRETSMQSSVEGRYARDGIDTFFRSFIIAAMKIIDRNYVFPFIETKQLAPVDALDIAFEEVYVEMRQYKNQATLRRILHGLIVAAFPGRNAFMTPQFVGKGIKSELQWGVVQGLQYYLTIESLIAENVPGSEPTTVIPTAVSEVQDRPVLSTRAGGSSTRGISQTVLSRSRARKIRALSSDDSPAPADSNDKYLDRATGILSFSDRHLGDFFKDNEHTDSGLPRKAGRFGWQKIARQVLAELTLLDGCEDIADVKQKFGTLKRYGPETRNPGRYGLTINEKWRIIFDWDGTSGPTSVEVANYHGE